MKYAIIAGILALGLIGFDMSVAHAATADREFSLQQCAADANMRAFSFFNDKGQQVTEACPGHAGSLTAEMFSHISDHIFIEQSYGFEFVEKYGYEKLARTKFNLAYDIDSMKVEFDTGFGIKSFVSSELKEWNHPTGIFTGGLAIDRFSPFAFDLTGYKDFNAQPIRDENFFCSDCGIKTNMKFVW